LNTVRISKLQQDYRIDVKYTLFPLHPYVPKEGIALQELFRGRNFDIKSSLLRLKNLAQAEGLEFGERSKTYNSRLAQELGKWAETQPNGKEIHNRLYRAYFVDDTNLADIDSLVAIAQALKLDGKAARSILESKAFSEAVESDWKRCQELGVMAVPTYFCNNRKLIGAQTYEALEGLVVSQGAVRLER
jgi:predicted DsbA family dithiol-disulfide isomerase